VLTSSVQRFQAYTNLLPLSLPGVNTVLLVYAAFARRLGQHMIRVNSVLPTFLSTPMLLKRGASTRWPPDLDTPRPDDLAPFLPGVSTPADTWLEAEDIINAAVLFLASDESRYIPVSRAERSSSSSIHNCVSNAIHHGRRTPLPMQAADPPRRRTTSGLSSRSPRPMRCRSDRPAVALLLPLVVSNLPTRSRSVPTSAHHPPADVDAVRSASCPRLWPY